MARHLRIAIVLDRFEPRRGGTERYASELVRRLRARGHDVTVVAARVDPDALHGAAWRRVAVPPVPRAWRVWAFARRAAALTRTGFDVVHGLQKSLGHTVFHAHTGSHRGSLRAARASRRTALGRALATVGKWCSAKQWVFAAIERRQYRQQPPPAFVAISPLVRRQMLELHGCAPAQVQLLPNPIDGERFAPASATARAAVRSSWGVAEDTRVGLFAASEPRLKGLGPLLRVFPKAGEVLVLAGDLPACDGGAGVVRALGHVADMAPVYGGADALILPTFYDPAPLVVLEALASGLRVLTTEACGLADLVRGGGGQVVADPWDAAALRTALDALWTAPAPSAAFREDLVTAHAWDRHLGALEAIYTGTRPDA